MTAAQIRTAARLLDEAGAKDSDFVTFHEFGSKGMFLALGSYNEKRESWTISKDGKYGS